MQQDNVVNKNVLKYTRNRFKTKKIICEEEYAGYKYMFDSSINMPEQYFTNFLTSLDCHEALGLLSIIDSLKIDIKKTIDEFDGSELIYNIKIGRLIEIIRTSYPNTILSDDELIFNVIKLKHSKFKNIQFFLRNNNQVLEIYLIDIYHLAIPAENPYTHKEDPKGIYNSKCKAKINLNEIINN